MLRCPMPMHSNGNATTRKGLGHDVPARRQVSISGRPGRGLSETKLSEINAAIVCGEEVQQAFVVGPLDVEQRQQPPVAASRRSEAPAHGLTEVMAGNVAVQEERLHVIPEIVLAGDE